MILVLITMLSLSHGAQTSPQQQPRVDARYKAEIDRIAAQGRRLKEAAEFTSEGARYLGAIFEFAKPADPDQQQEFRIIENAGGVARTLFKRSDFDFRFPSEPPFSKLNGTDINLDGAAEVIVESSSGGNCWSCNPTEIYTLRAHKAELIAAGPIRNAVDLNGDGSVELMVSDTRWEFYSDLSHVASPGATMIYTWKGGRYIYASRDYSAYYASELKELRERLAEARSAITMDDEYSDESYVGTAVSIALTYSHLGDPARAMRELESMLTVGALSARQKKRRVEIITDFKTGESAGRIREMKYGMPMPLG